MEKQIKECIEMGRLHFEKCELGRAKEAFERALAKSKKSEDANWTIESLTWLLRFAGEANLSDEVDRIESEMLETVRASGKEAPISYWFAMGRIAWFRNDTKLAQSHYRRYLLEARKRSAIVREDQNLAEAKALIVLAQVSCAKGHFARARLLLNTVQKRYERLGLRGINGACFTNLGFLCEREKKFKEALIAYRKAHAYYLKEHNWYHHLYVLLGYARVARLQQNYTQSYFYLDLIEKACAPDEFGMLRHEVKRERNRLENAAVDLLIDSKKGIVRTRDGGQISLRKQYVLLDILKALSKAHNLGEDDHEKGLSKGQIIEQVWKENYRPEAHDNKLYYNINRLRKLIEPNFRQPCYLINWREGYRFAPGLRVQLIGANLDSGDPLGTATLRISRES